MPTILELFKGSTFDKAVKADKDTVIEQELTGIRKNSAVELNNPLIYGNQAIRIATRSTSTVEIMKQATGGEAATGGLIGKGLGSITGGGFGKAVFGGKVTSLNQARDGINSKLGIPQNLIPTFVKNTGKLQIGKEQKTMETLAEIKNDASGTILGKFLQQSGGGNPVTLGKQILGQGISLGKNKLKTALFGNPAAMGSNTAKTANDGYEYSSDSPYSEQIKQVRDAEATQEKLSTPTADSIAQLEKITNKKLLEKKKLGKDSLTNTEGRTIPNTIKKTTPELPYTKTLGNYKIEPEDKLTRIDLSLVSPVYGVDRKNTNGKYGKSDYAFQDVKNNTGRYSPWNPQEKYTDTNKKNWETLYGITNGGDVITQSPVKTRSEEELKQIENQDLIPFWIKSKRSDRTVHFRSYVTAISETTSPTWNTSKFFGNPYNFYTYDGIERSVQFTLNVVCLNQFELASNWEKLEFLTQQTYPTFGESETTKTFAIPPIISFRLGNIYKDKIGFIDSLSYTIPDTGVWETNVEGLLLPKFIEVGITIKFIEQVGSQSVIYNIKRSGDAISIINEQNQSQGGSFTTDAISTNEQPAKVDEYGVESKETKEGGVNKTQTNIGTGKSEPTPQDKQSGEISTGDNRTTEVTSEKDERVKKIKNKIPNVTDLTAQSIAFNSEINLDSFKKLNENEYYFEQTYGEGRISKMAMTLGTMGFTAQQYDMWVSYDNGGVDPLKQ
jgi:hypothetical protein